MPLVERKPSPSSFQLSALRADPRRIFPGREKFWPPAAPIRDLLKEEKEVAI
jgi:hypothetical protein